MGEKDITSRFNEIYDATNNQALAFITAKCGIIDDVNDILQETYMELYKVLCDKGADYVENDEAFVIRIAKQKVYQHYTLLQKAKSDLSLSVITGEEEKSIYENDLEELTIEDSLCTNELVSEIEKIIASKSQEIRKIFFLRFSMEKSIGEISSLMGKSQSYIKNKLYRTIKEIRQLYDEKGDLV